MSTASLAYLGVRSDKLDDWNDFACNLLGMQQVDRGGKSLSYRMDDFEQRLLVSNEPGDTLSFMGWEVAGEDDLERFAAKLDAAGVEVEWGSTELADRRFVERLLVCHDPDGNRVELVWNPMRTSEPFVPGRTITGFKTGPLGMGHAVLHVTDIEKQLAFYRDLLGFELSDFGNMPVPIHFLHVNGRHHSLAMIASGQKGFHHFMVEFQSLDDVGQGYDLAGATEDRVGFTLGRHTNDFMTSFYARTPSGFFVENGWGGRIIDPATWQPVEIFDGPSLWGHDWVDLPDEARAMALNQRIDLASRGVQSPPFIDCPWLFEQVAKT